MDHYNKTKSVVVFLVLMVSFKGFKGNNVTFNWKSCGGEGFIMTNIKVSPNPLKIPGNVTVSADIQVTTKLHNLSADAIFLGKFGDTYEIIPSDCKMGGVLANSCGVDDLCAEWSTGNCPPYIKTIDPDCSCPLQIGMFRIPPYVMQIPYDFPEGEYRLKEEIKMNGAVVACIESKLNITEHIN